MHAPSTGPDVARGYPREAPASRPGVAALVGVALAVVFAELLVLVWAGWRPLADADTAVSDGLNAWVADHPGAVDVLHGVTDGLQPWVVRMLTAAAAAWLWWRRRRRVATWALAGVWGGGVLVWLLKPMVDRARPVVPEPVSDAAGASFPSGHAVGAVAGAGALVVLTRVWPLRARRVASVVGGSVAVLVPFTRVALGVHYVSDVVGGALLAAAWLALTGAALTAAARPMPQRVRRVRSPPS